MVNAWDASNSATQYTFLFPDGENVNSNQLSFSMTPYMNSGDHLGTDEITFYGM
ncbi:MAG: hypothetical protein J6Y86_07410 [Pseudobutyrivibrio sp.]|nr:hypothetical protein [Pseudobutyrivibrio sp.]